MLGVFDVIKDKLKPKQDAICIDNWIFKLHYRATVILLIIATILVTTREYIGEHIKCISDMNQPGFEKVIETYCFFTSTFTVVNPKDFSYMYGNFLHPGILPYGIGSPQETRQHYYYQWVPFMLFGQSVLFYVTHLLWKSFENHRIEKLLHGLKTSRNTNVRNVKEIFMGYITSNKSWAVGLIFFEVLNCLHVMFEFYITNRFLGYKFKTLGANVINNGSSVLDEIFPKMTKCIFHKYGPSGSIQNHDALCVLALNIVIEKIYLIMWFWLLFLFCVSVMVLVWRLLTIFLYSKCMKLNQLIFARGKISLWNIKTVMKSCRYCDWLLLRYISKNMHVMAFRKLFLEISEDLEEKKPLFMLSQSDNSNDLNKFS